ncbi:ribose 5-phosphate isomerase B [Robertmurraya korlensis]|uniref:ribose 5-phosphate isomerase B n=1 Tax=Robertmurraya korlensis TaxID=519977 RepID=UPI00203E967C|nr:ribose 5-phosphate isomerase B [Robertmurraya korlensis]MCM3602598.1 ribose 5-phosphate isomerase B [Robertmurraya korlensis]
MKIALGCDHGGYLLKESIKNHLEKKGFECLDYGTHFTESVNYPLYAKKVGYSVANLECELGILCCGTGIGMSIAANKMQGVRAAVVSDTFSARATREHNNSNVLCLGERVVGESLALVIVDTWLEAEFQGGRHQERLDLVEQLERSLKYKTI